MILEMPPFIKGILTAFVMTVAVGPGMLLNIHASLRRGFVAGLTVVIGLYVSDATFIAINYIGVSQFVNNFHHQRFVGIACGVVVCILGISMVSKKSIGITVQESADPAPKTNSLFRDFMSGFLVNMANPFVFIFWMTLMSIATLNFGFHSNSFYEYFAGVLGTALCLDILKSYLFSRVKTGLQPKAMARINHGVGTVLVSVGIVMIFRSIAVFGQPIHP
jgi:threonine/homoserine/homoserine lactone efflux protein